MIDFITGDKFKGIADFVYAPQGKHPDDYDGLLNTLKTGNLRDINVVYTHTFYVKQLFEVLSQLKEQFVVVTHNSDMNVDKSFSVPDNVSKWFSQNVNVIHEKIESIPIGLENDRWFPSVNKKGRMIVKMKQLRVIKNLVYINHNMRTNPDKRIKPYELLIEHKWVTAETKKNGDDFDSYLDNIYNHQFVICPEGNGMDTHRTWECLYMGTVPIEKRNINNQFHTDLPICFVDEWEEVTEDFLYRWLIGKKFHYNDWNMQKLLFSYWTNRITGKYF